MHMYLYWLSFSASLAVQFWILSEGITNDSPIYASFAVLMSLFIALTVVFVYYKQLDFSEMKKVSDMRSEFISNATHELKTPLVAIRGAVEALKNDAVNDPEKTQRSLDVLALETERLQSLIDELLELGHIENIKTHDDVADIFDINNTISHCIELLSEMAVQHNVKMHYNTTPSILVMANENRIKQLLINIISNAILYNKPEGDVFVTVSASGKKLIMNIRDTGRGIDSKHIPRMFERFYRFNEGETDGRGLGLSIVKHLTELYKGNIKVKSILGVGSEFTVTMPICCEGERANT